MISGQVYCFEVPLTVCFIHYSEYCLIFERIASRCSECTFGDVRFLLPSAHIPLWTSPLSTIISYSAVLVQLFSSSRCFILFYFILFYLFH